MRTGPSWAKPWASFTWAPQPEGVCRAGSGRWGPVGTGQPCSAASAEVLPNPGVVWKTAVPMSLPTSPQSSAMNGFGREPAPAPGYRLRSPGRAAVPRTLLPQRSSRKEPAQTSLRLG